MKFEFEDGKKHSAADTSGMQCVRCGEWVYKGIMHMCKDLIGPRHLQGIPPEIYRKERLMFESAAEAQFWMKVVESAASGQRSISLSIEMADIAVGMLRERVPASWRPKVEEEPRTMAAQGDGG